MVMATKFRQRTGECSKARHTIDLLITHKEDPTNEVDTLAVCLRLPQLLVRLGACSDVKREVAQPNGTAVIDVVPLHARSEPTT
jgi:hypothetical protein